MTSPVHLSGNIPGEPAGRGQSPQTTQVLGAHALTLSIRGTPILKDVSFDVARGEILALTGESGSGKSMTALAIMGLLPDGSQTSGSLMFQDRNLLTTPEADLCTLRGNEIGMIFQEPMTALNPVQTIGAQVAEAVRLHAPEADVQAVARETLSRVGLPPERYPLSRYPHELSGGQRQRVVIAIAIAMRPKLLIADEPTTALDVTTQAQILDLLTDLTRQDGMAMILITHDLAVVADRAHRLAVMKSGEIVEHGPTHQVLRTQAHAYTRALFAASRHRAALPKAGAGDPILRVEDVVRTYLAPRRLFRRGQPTCAVDGVSFSIGAGERVGLVGESGCGKSTLTRAILGLERIQSGRIEAFGQAVGPDMPAALRAGIQVVFQDPYGSFNPRHRVARLVSEPFHLIPDAPAGKQRRARVDAVLEAVGLKANDADKYIHAFSGGQRQRIAIARALITNPELIVFDEAVSALDVRVRAQVLDLIAGLARERNLAWLFISHDLSVVDGITDRVLVMQAGKIVEQGPTQEVFARPSHPYTQQLLAAAPKLEP